MSIAAVAKKDFRDAVQSRALWALLAVFVVLWGGLVALIWFQFQNTMN